MKKILNILRIISIVIILFLAAIVFIPNILGITPTIDLLGTMKPKISKGSISYVNRGCKYNDIKENDIIQIRMYNQDIMVRVKSKNKKDNTLNVKGDAESKQEIKVISKKEFIGKHVFSIPKVGFLVLFLQRFFFLTIILVIIIVISLIIDFMDYKNSKTQEIQLSKDINKRKKDLSDNKDKKMNIESDKEQEKLEKELNRLKEENNIQKEESKKNENKKCKEEKKENIEILDDDEIKEINRILELENNKSNEPEVLEPIDEEDKTDDIL